MKPWAEKFYKSAAWRRCRAAVKKRSFGLCERCGKPGSIAHHKIYLTKDNINDPNITLSLSNLEFLCQECHNKEHGYFARSEEEQDDRFYFDSDGNIVLTPQQQEGRS